MKLYSRLEQVDFSPRLGHLELPTLTTDVVRSGTMEQFRTADEFFSAHSEPSDVPMSYFIGHANNLWCENKPVKLVSSILVLDTQAIVNTSSGGRVVVYSDFRILRNRAMMDQFEASFILERIVNAANCGECELRQRWYDPDAFNGGCCLFSADYIEFFVYSPNASCSYPRTSRFRPSAIPAEIAVCSFDFIDSVEAKGYFQ